MLSLSGAASAQAPAKAAAAPAKAAVTPAPAPAPATAAASPAPVITLAAAAAAAAPAPEQTRPDVTPAPTNFPAVTFGVVSFLQYAAELHGSDGYNSFDVTRGYLNIQARLSDRVKVRFTPDVRPTTDASLERNLALRLEYASLDVQASDGVAIMFGLHEMPWLTFEESTNRYRVLGPFFAERLGLIPGATDLGASIKATVGTRGPPRRRVQRRGLGTRRSRQVQEHRWPRDFPSVRGRQRTGQSDHLGVLPVRLVCQRPPAQRGHRDGQLREHHIVASAQYLSATDNPFVAVDVERSGMSFFGEAPAGSHRMGRGRSAWISSTRTRRTRATRRAA